MSDARSIEEAGRIIGAGGIVVYPTETLYGLGVAGHSAAALDNLIALKGRGAGRGMSLLVRDLDSAADLIAGPVADGARRLAAGCWPGPLTIVLPASAAVPEALVGPAGGVGLRCSPDPVCRALVEAAGAALTSTSANPSGSAPATTCAQARAYFAQRVDCYLDDGPRDGAPSSVVEFLGGTAYLRRAGAIAAEHISQIVPLQPE